jgi:hypothetical protein
MSNPLVSQANAIGGNADHSDFDFSNRRIERLVDRGPELAKSPAHP